jgi:uncharacterized membrane protein (UPF0127 family)
LHCAGRFVDRLHGLLGLGPLARGHGLWLVPCKAVHSFGMRVPIDLLFVDADFEVVAVRSMFGPCRIALCRRARSTIEMAPGDVMRLRITVGSRLVLERPTSIDLRPEPLGGALDARRSFPGLQKRS